MHPIVQCPYCSSNEVHCIGTEHAAMHDDTSPVILFIYHCPTCEIEFASDIENYYPPAPDQTDWFENENTSTL